MSGFVSGNVNLTDDECDGLSPAHARVLHSLAGRIRRLRELATGAQMSTTEPMSIQKNPQGLYGVDKSSPPWGPAWRHPLGGSGGLKPDSSGAGAWSGHRVTGTVEAGVRLTVPIRIYVRAHEESALAPYSRGYVVLEMYQAAAVAAFDVTVRLRSSPGSDAAAREATISVTSTTTLPYEPSTIWFDLKPGINDLELELETASSTDAILAFYSINNIEKRSHA